MRLVEINQVGVFLGMRAVDPGDAANARRVDRQHLVDERLRRLRRHHRLHRVEVRGAGHDQDRRARVRQGRHPRQLDPPRRHRHADDAARRPRRHDRGRPGRDVRQFRPRPWSGHPKRSRTWRSSSPPTSRATAPAPSSSSTAACSRGSSTRTRERDPITRPHERPGGDGLVTGSLRSPVAPPARGTASTRRPAGPDDLPPGTRLAALERRGSDRAVQPGG